MGIDRFHSRLAQLGMDIDLRDTKRDRLLDVLIADSGSSVKDQRYVDFLVDLLQDLEVQLRLGRINTVHVSDCDCKRIASRSLDEFLRLVRLGVVIVRQSLFIDGLISNMSQLSLYRNVQRMEVIYAALDLCDILLKGKRGSVAHDRIHAVVDCVLKDRHIAAVIPVLDDRNGSLLSHGIHHIAEVFKYRIAGESCSERDDDRCTQFLCSIDNTHEHLCVPYVEMRDRIMSVASLLLPISDVR